MCHTILSAHGYRMLIGACDPMACPIHRKQGDPAHRRAARVPVVPVQGQLAHSSAQRGPEPGPPAMRRTALGPAAAWRHPREAAPRPLRQGVCRLFSMTEKQPLPRPSRGTQKRRKKGTEYAPTRRGACTSAHNEIVIARFPRCTGVWLFINNERIQFVVLLWLRMTH